MFCTCKTKRVLGMRDKFSKMSGVRPPLLIGGWRFEKSEVFMSSTKISRFDFVSRLACVDNHPVIIYECPSCGSEIVSQPLDDGLYYMNGDDVVCPCGDFQFSLYLDVSAYYRS